MGVERGAGVGAQRRTQYRIGFERLDPARQSFRIADPDRVASARFPKDRCDFPAWIADMEGGATGGKDAVDLAGHHQPFERGLQAGQVYVGQAKAFAQPLARLVGLEPDVGQLALGGLPHEPLQLVAAANEQEDHILPFPQLLCSGEDGVEFVRPAHVSRIGYDKFPGEIPGRAQGGGAVGAGHAGLAVRPVVDDAEVRRGQAGQGPQFRVHPVAQHHVAGRRAK